MDEGDLLSRAPYYFHIVSPLVLDEQVTLAWLSTQILLSELCTTLTC